MNLMLKQRLAQMVKWRLKSNINSLLSHLHDYFEDIQAAPIIQVGITNIRVELDKSKSPTPCPPCPYR